MTTERQPLIWHYNVMMPSEANIVYKAVEARHLGLMGGTSITVYWVGLRLFVERGDNGGNAVMEITRRDAAP